jgi:hypothetical protein
MSGPAAKLAPPATAVGILAGLAIYAGFEGIGMWILGTAITGMVISSSVGIVTDQVEAIPFLAPVGGIIGAFVGVLMRIELWLG